MNINRMYDPSHLYGQTAVDWDERINMETLRKKRLEKTREAM